MDRKSSDVEDEQRENPEGTPPPTVAGIDLNITVAVFSGCLFALAQSFNTPATLADAEDFLRRVRRVYRNTPQKYVQFLEIILTVRERRISTSEAFLLAFDLFKGHFELLEEFTKSYLPAPYDEYRASTSTEDSNIGASSSHS